VPQPRAARYEQLQKLQLRRLTSDLDSTVMRTGDKLAWALRGFNPYQPKDPSYYPRLAQLAPTGQILRLKHRPWQRPPQQGRGALRCAN
jgi:hypothetical protein